MARREIVNTVIVDGYTPVHPALDFYDNGGIKHAIVSVGQQLRNDYSNGDVEFCDGEITVLSSGECFQYSKKALAERNLYYSRHLDLPLSRWEYQDIQRFCQEVKEHLDDNTKNIDCMSIASLYKSIRETVDFYMDYEDERIYDLVACFIIYTHFYPLFGAAPVVQIWGEAKTGKTKTVTLLNALCFNPVHSSNMSESSVFRLVEGRRSTLLLDESEDLEKTERGRAISNLLLAGYSRSGETFRQEKVSSGNSDRYKTQSFRVFSPKIIANIEGISLIPLQTRIIRIVLTGAKDKTKSNRDVNPEDVMFQTLRNHLYRSIMTKYQDIEIARDKLPETGLNDRTFAIWQGILAVSYLIDGMPEDMNRAKLTKRLISYATYNYAEMQAEIDRHSTGQSLLKELYLIVEERGDIKITSKELLAILNENEDLEIENRRQLGNLMRRLGFVSKPIRHGATVLKEYDLKLSELMARISRI